MEIRRDTYGVPYIQGNSDAACVYGLGYAQAEDGFEHLEDNVLRAIGRASEVHGEKTFNDDRLVRALEIPSLAKQEFARAPAHMREIYLAYLAGIERYRDDRGVKLKLLDRFEAWHPLALIRYKYHVLEFLGYAGLRPEDVQFELHAMPERAGGSNAWAIAPSKSASGKAMLFINPHVGFFGPTRYYECTLRSEQGLHFHGTGRYGFPLPYMGHNQHLGWGNTDNYPDFCDLYTEHFDFPADPLAYRYGKGRRKAKRWVERVGVRSAGGTVANRNVTFTRTHHGPIVGNKKGKPVAARLSKLVEGGWYDQCYAMLRARSLDEFKAALAPCDIPYMNITYADRDGNIFYAYNAAIPVRSEEFNWREPVDGSDPRTEWRGYHPFKELPQILNPASGYVQNCNSTPFATTSGTVPAGHFPAYMIGPEVDNPRAKVSREILEEKRLFTFEEWTRAATDTRLYVAREGVREISAAWEGLVASDPRRAALQPIVEALQRWDQRASIESIPATIFILWYGRRRVETASPARVLQWLEEARDDLVSRWGDWRVQWGDANRLQDLHWSGEGNFSDKRPSHAVAGAPGWLGVVFNFYADPPEGTKSAYGRRGNSFVSVVEFGATPRARSIMVLGQAQETASPHRMDQAELYAAGKFKPIWSSPADITANTRPTASFRIPE